MAFGAKTVWEVRSTGADSNGGGFDSGVASPGTDYSVQDAAQVAYTDLVIDGTTNTKITSVAHPFDSTSPGNILNVTSGTGFTVQRVEILSVAANVATCDKAVGTLSSTGGHGNFGGGLATPGQAAALWVSQNTIYIKAATYDMSSTANVSGGRVNFTIGGTATTSIVGYNTTRTLTNTDTTLPTLRPSANSMICVDNFNGGNFLYVRNLIFNANSFTNCSALRNDNSEMMWENCQATGFAGGGTAFNCQFSTTKIINCYATGCSIGFTLHATTDMVIGCVATACTTRGFDDSGVTGGRYYHCISYANTGEGYKSTTAGSFYFGCTSYGNTGATGQGFSVTDEAQLVNCAATGNALFGFMSNKASPSWARLINCADFNNTSGRADTNFYSDINGVSLSADPWTNGGTGNFTPNTTTGGGAALAAGFPATYPQNLTNNYNDIGAAQHQAVASTTIVVKRQTIVR